MTASDREEVDFIDMGICNPDEGNANSSPLRESSPVFYPPQNGDGEERKKNDVRGSYEEKRRKFFQSIYQDCRDSIEDEQERIQILARLDEQAQKLQEKERRDEQIAQDKERIQSLSVEQMQQVLELAKWARLGQELIVQNPDSVSAATPTNMEHLENRNLYAVDTIPQHVSAEAVQEIAEIQTQHEALRAQEEDDDDHKSLDLNADPGY